VKTLTLTLTIAEWCDVADALEAAANIWQETELEDAPHPTEQSWRRLAELLRAETAPEVR
jgi:hypothetical protein